MPRPPQAESTDCSECGAKFSSFVEDALACPRCGAIRRRPLSCALVVVVVGLLHIGGAWLALAMGWIGVERGRAGGLGLVAGVVGGLLLVALVVWIVRSLQKAAKVRRQYRRRDGKREPK